MQQKTRQFRDLLQENIQDVLGTEVPMDICWSLYKTIIVTNLQFLIGAVDPEKMEDVKLVLRGIGVWKINFRKPFAGGRKKSNLIGKTKWVPFFRFSPSTRFRRILLKKFCGIVEPVPVSKKRLMKMEAKKEE